jgi:SAM-dependent methyltransferase
VSFDVTADAYARFMGRFADPLAVSFLAWADVDDAHKVLDVGCGPGTLTALLVRRFGSAAVSAIDPSAPFVAATRSRFPEVDVRSGAAEALPYDDHAFDAALAQLVVHFMDDPVAGLAEMGRVTRPGGVVAACVWDHAGGSGPLSTFWQAAHDLDPSTPGESDLPGTREGQLAELCEGAGLAEVQSSRLTVQVGFATYDDWWAPYTLGVGPAGTYVAGLTAEERERLRARCVALLPPAPFRLEASAWAVRARA